LRQAARYSEQERITIVEAYFATKTIIQSQWQLRSDFPVRNAATRFTIKRLLLKLLKFKKTKTYTGYD